VAARCRKALLSLGWCVVAVAIAAGGVQAARPVARWDVVPDQRLSETFNVGVCAFHVEGVKVEFRVGGTLVHTADNPTLNPRTGVWEFWFPLDPSAYADGPLAVDARAIPLAAGHESYDLPTLNLYANSGGSLGSSVVKWADAAGGSDANPGTEALPYKTLAKAVKNTPSGGTVYLKTGSYSSDALGGGSARPYWTTVAAAPGVDRDLVEVGRGRPGTQRIKWKDLTLFADYTGGYYTILVGEDGNHSVWIDNVKTYNKRGRWAASAITFGNRYVSYVTGGVTTEMANGPGGSLIRDHQLLRICSDAWTGGGRLIVNCSCTDINPGSTGAHPDFHQSYAPAPSWCQDVILYNVRGYECISQGLFGHRLRHSAFVNLLFEKYNTVMCSQYSREMENVLYLHMDIIYQTWHWRGTGDNALDATDLKLYNNIFQNMGLIEDATDDGLDLDHNHFVDPARTMGTHITTGDAGYLDPAANDYRIADTSPAWGTGRPLQCVPADIDGKAYHPTARNRGCYAREDAPAMGVTAWMLIADFGPAGEQHVAAEDGYVHANAAPPSALRITLSQPVDPDTLGDHPISVTGQTSGDQAALLGAASLDGGNTTIVVPLTAALPDADRYTVSLAAGLRSASGDPVEGDASLEMALLAGDADASGAVTTADILAVRARAGQLLSATTLRFDVDASGSITGTDLAAVRSRLGRALP